MSGHARRSTAAALVLLLLGGCAATSERDAPVPGFLAAVTATDDGFVAVGGIGDPVDGLAPLVLASSDGRRWQREDVPSEGGRLGGLGDVAFGNRALATTGPGQRLTLKPQGRPWELRGIGTNNDRVMFGNGVFLSTASVEPGAMVSSDADVWTRVQIGGPWFAFDGARFIALVPGPIVPVPGDPSMEMSTPDVFRTSVDGLLWLDTGAQVTQHTPWVLSYARVGDQTLAIGLGDCDRGRLGCLVQLLGPAGTDPWELEPTPLENAGLNASSRTSIASDDARVVVTFPSQIRTTPLPVGSAPWRVTEVAPHGWTLGGVSHRGGTFVAVGAAGDPPRVLIVTSPDAETWTEAELPL